MQELNESVHESKRFLNLSWWQHALLNDVESDYIATTAGYGSGKTFAYALTAIDRLAYNKGCDGIFIEPTHKLTEQVAIPAFYEAFEALGYTSKHFRIIGGQSNARVQMWNGQKIFLLSGHIPENIVGITTAAFAILDEAALMKQEVLAKTSARVRYGKAKKTQIFMPSTPEGFNWYSDLFDSCAQPGWYQVLNSKDMRIERSKYVPGFGEVSQTYRRFRGTTYANRHNLSPDYIPKLYEQFGHNQNYIDSYVYGFFRPFSTGLAYSNYNAVHHKIPDIEASPHIPLYMTWDYNVGPVWVTIQQQTIKDGHGRITKYWAALDNANLQYEQIDGAVAEFAVKYPVYKFGNTPIMLCGDSSGNAKSHKVKGSDYDNIKGILKSMGYTQVEICAIKSNPLERTSVDYVQHALFNRYFRICEKCDMVLKSISRTTWKDGERAKLDKPAGDHWTHPMDAVKYFFCMLHSNSRKRMIGGRL